MNRQEIRRLMPPNIDNLYEHIPGELYEAYGLVCDALYVGDARDDIEGGNRGNRKPSVSGWFFKDTRFFAIKAAADFFLTGTSKALRRWQEASDRHGAARPAQAGVGVVPRAGQTGRATGDVQDAKEIDG